MSQLRNNIQKVVDAIDYYNSGKGDIMLLKEQIDRLTEEELMVLLIEHPILWFLIDNPTEEMLMLKQITG